MNRRNLIMGIGAATTAVLAGCTGSEDDSENGGGPTDNGASDDNGGSDSDGDNGGGDGDGELAYDIELHGHSIHDTTQGCADLDSDGNSYSPDPMFDIHAHDTIQVGGEFVVNDRNISPVIENIAYDSAADHVTVQLGFEEFDFEAEGYEEFEEHCTGEDADGGVPFSFRIGLTPEDGRNPASGQLDVQYPDGRLVEEVETDTNEEA